MDIKNRTRITTSINKHTFVARRNIISSYVHLSAHSPPQKFDIVFASNLKKKKTLSHD